MKSTIHIGKDISELNNFKLANGNVFVIIDNNLQYLAEHFKQFTPIYLKADEENKTLESVSSLATALLEAGADRDALIIGVGGGITTDITGFTASIYKRGVKFAFVPTTLLAQVDASIGGKNGTNLHSYKNILGTISQPEWIFICPQLLNTLPEDEFKAGIAEVLKTFILFDKEMYATAAEYFSQVAQKYGCREDKGKTYGEIAVEHNLELLTQIIGKCAQYKSGVVERDEFEKGERRLLNLGHTFAHSIEKLTQGKVSHGYAVSIGMVIAARIAQAMGAAQEGFPQKLAQDLRSCGLPATLRECTAAAHLKIGELAKAIKKDKKVHGNSIHFILPKGLENVEDILVPITEINNIADDLR